MILRVVLTEKSELSLNEKDVFPQTFHRSISNKPRSLYCVKRSLHKRILKLFIQAHWPQSHTIMDFSNFRKHCYIFTPAAFHTVWNVRL